MSLHPTPAESIQIFKQLMKVSGESPQSRRIPHIIRKSVDLLIEFPSQFPQFTLFWIVSLNTTMC